MTILLTLLAIVLGFEAILNRVFKRRLLSILADYKKALNETREELSTLKSKLKKLNLK